MVSRLILLSSLTCSAYAQLAQTLVTKAWTDPFPPFRIVGNVYWVGTYDLSSYLIVTPQGDILINTGLADSVPQIRSNIETLGFKVSDIKILMATHAHWDHVAGMAEMKRITGARLLATGPGFSPDLTAQPQVSNVGRCGNAFWTHAQQAAGRRARRRRVGALGAHSRVAARPAL